MRESKIIKLDDDRQVKVKELRFKEVRFILKELAKNGEVDISLEEIFTTRLDEFEEVINSIVDFPSGETLDDMSFSELDLIYQGSKEVNPTFLALMQQTGFGPAVKREKEEPETSETLTEQPSS